MYYKFLLATALVFLIILSPSYVHAQSDVILEASVGRFYFSASGIVSPYASVVMTSQDLFLSSTVANDKGEFLLPAALVNDGFDEFCIEAVDIRRIGTSYTCFESESPQNDISRENIFLPPTVGLSGRKIEPNSSITASGYTMPGSLVDIYLGEGFQIETRADEDGFYEMLVQAEAPPGKYELYATSVYGVQTSEKPTRTFTVEVLGLASMIPSWLIWFILILILILIFILIIILWKRRRKKDKGAKGSKKTNPSHFQKFFFWRA